MCLLFTNRLFAFACKPFVQKDVPFPFATLVRCSLRDREMEDNYGLEKYGIEIVGKSWLRNILWSRLGVS